MQNFEGADLYMLRVRHVEGGGDILNPLVMGDFACKIFHAFIASIPTVGAS